MTREEAKELLTDMMMSYVPKDQYGDYGDPEPYEQAYDMAIEALQAERHGEWIPCSERLPDIEQDVLATTALFGIREVTFAWRINDGEWLIREGSAEATNNDILAWMPLPKPYKESEKNHEG